MLSLKKIRKKRMLILRKRVRLILIKKISLILNFLSMALGYLNTTSQIIATRPLFKALMFMVTIIKPSQQETLEGCMGDSKGDMLSLTGLLFIPAYLDPILWKIQQA